MNQQEDFWSTALMSEETPESSLPTTKTESALDVASLVASAVPWIGGPVSNVLGGMSLGRKLTRVREVLEGVAADLRDFKSTASEQYVGTEDFEELLEETLQRVARERSAEKRQTFRRFLVGAITSPGEPYDEQLRILRILEEMQPDHLRILSALGEPPDEDAYAITGSPMQTLQRRLRGMAEDRIDELIRDLNDWRVTNLTSLRTMMTPRGAEDLTAFVTPHGRRFLRYLVEE